LAEYENVGSLGNRKVGVPGENPRNKERTNCKDDIEPNGTRRLFGGINNVHIEKNRKALQFLDPGFSSVINATGWNFSVNYTFYVKIELSFKQ